MKKQFPDWLPEVGERALTPGRQVRELDQADIAAIEAGQRGYTPLLLEIVDTCLTRIYPHAIRMILNYREDKRVWWGDGVFKTPGVALRAVRREFGGGEAIQYRVDNERNRFFNNPSKKGQVGQ